MKSKKTSVTSVFVKALFGFMTAMWICSFACGQQPLRISTQQREPSPYQDEAWVVTNHIEAWKPSETALIVCDMWDKHWCDISNARFGELAASSGSSSRQRCEDCSCAKRLHGFLCGLQSTQRGYEIQRQGNSDISQRYQTAFGRKRRMAG
jgi:hypothetical protein